MRTPKIGFTYHPLSDAEKDTTTSSGNPRYAENFELTMLAVCRGISIRETWRLTGLRWFAGSRLGERGVLN